MEVNSYVRHGFTPGRTLVVCVWRASTRGWNRPRNRVPRLSVKRPPCPARASCSETPVVARHEPSWRATRVPRGGDEL